MCCCDPFLYIYSIHYDVIFVVIEAADPIDVLFGPNENTRNNPNTQIFDVKLCIEITDPNNQLISSRSTDSHQFMRGSLSFRKEVCVFRNMYSYYKMRILLYAERNRNLYCTGVLDIPLSRLEEDAVVSSIYTVHIYIIYYSSCITFSLD